MKSITIFDPAMCCSTGVCGPSVDPELTRVANALFKLEQNGVEVNRYNLANDPAAFVENHEAKSFLEDKGIDSLPLIYINGEQFAEGTYPSNSELADAFGLEEDQLVKKKPKLTIDLKQI
ncbi:arsenite efflux transporter metallochaperone ArsD [Jeotgalibacillus salarius]|uniref:Arsenite efflux transporter metallochaperone ArsD n=1 Tax=Jeotgalibacillus salarius TaxID=546023 RepID=A0A4Y8LC33_9BACL|nr:arsenite efflux transporter metallochaperone ArsD [Jeotgalibacillus salarius]TFD99730.1 arsenite efflux transporter metallochaperone ArsD [Jeotgalibacillus salarius]